MSRRGDWWRREPEGHRRRQSPWSENQYVDETIVNGAGFAKVLCPNVMREARPFRARLLRIDRYPGLTRPGLLNRAPFGLIGRLRRLNIPSSGINSARFANTKSVPKYQGVECGT
jgi:hypothetical protein